MISPTLTERRSPWVVLATANDPWVAAETAALRDGGGLVFRLNGNELLEPDLLFRAFARELGFLGYFGHNWDALADCLQDWHGPGHGRCDVAILIEDADALIEVEFLGLFVAVLCQAAWHANLRFDADGVRDESCRQRFALHFVLLLTSASPADFAHAAATDKDVRMIEAGGRFAATLSDAEWPTDLS